MSVLYVRDKSGALTPVYSIQGENGRSAYELAVEKGFEGTEEEWLASLVGEPGDDYVLTEEDESEIADKVVGKIGTVLNRIDPAKVPNGDPTNPSTNHEVGTFAGVYMEYYGSDKKWRPRVHKSNTASYASLTDAAVEKFKENLLSARIPMTDSAGRLSVAAPQKGKSGLYYYHNPSSSTATNNAYNMAVPLWYADERYVKQTTYDSKVSALEKTITALTERIAALEEKLAN